MNAGAGAFNQKLAADVESELASTFAHHGVAAKFVFVDGEDLQNSAKSALAQAKRGEIDAVVIGGGDGSIRTVAGVLADTNIPLGVLPLGTLNHFAKDLGAPLACGCGGGRGRGWSCPRSRSRRGQRRDLHQQFLDRHLSLHGHRPGAAKGERTSSPNGWRWCQRSSACCDISRGGVCASRRKDLPVRTARPACSSATTNTAPSCSALGRRHHLDRGELWFYVVKPRNPLEFLLMVWRLCFGHMEQARDLDTFRLREAEIGARTSRLPVALDGEVRILHTPLEYRSRPGALRILAPAQPEA